MSERSSSVPLIVRAAMSASMSNRSTCYELRHMADLLTTYAQLQPDKLAVVDDRLGTDVRSVTFAEFEGVTNQLAHVLRDHGVGPGVKVVWCGQNSMGVANLVVAARKVGATAVPLNYRLSDEEAAYVRRPAASASGRLRRRRAGAAVRALPAGIMPKVTDVLIFDGPAPGGDDGGRRADLRGRTGRAAAGAGRVRGRRRPERR